MTDGIIRSVTHRRTVTQVPFPVPEAVLSGILLDDFPSAALAYSFRKLRTAYAGSAVRIRRDSDNAEQDIGFSGNDFDTAEAASFIGEGGIGWIVTWYDQSGNGLNVTQSSAASQPAYRATLGPSSLPTAEFGIFATSLATANIDITAYISTQGTIFGVVYQEGTAAQNTLLSWVASTRLVCHPTYDDVLYFDFGSTGGGGRINVAQPSGWDDAWHLLELFRTVGNSQNITADGVNLISGSRTDAITTGSVPFIIGHVGNSAYLEGFVSELVIWGTDLAASRTLARSNINTYWTVF